MPENNQSGRRIAATPDVERLLFRAGEVFRPAAPITTQALFAGRVGEIRKVADAVSSAGQHAVVYGERGVGKTSLANILAPYLKTLGAPHLFSKVNCDRSDKDFPSVWRKAFEEIRITIREKQIGFGDDERATTLSMAENLPRDLTPNDVKGLLQRISPAVLIFDEFDRLPVETAVTFTDLIKMLSDNVVPATIIVVGVADTVDQLIRDHRSIERALIQIQMPRMTEMELLEILDKAAAQLQFKFKNSSRQYIVKLSEGLPHYVHLLGLYTVRHAAERGSLEVTMDDVKSGLHEAVENASQTIKREFHEATRSARQEALFEHVLLACALAAKDELSFFRAADVGAPLTEIMGKKYEITSFALHLKKFCSEERGNVLVKTGKKRGYRYRFRNPLLEPYVIMRGLADGLIEGGVLERLGSGMP